VRTQPTSFGSYGWPVAGRAAVVSAAHFKLGLAPQGTEKPPPPSTLLPDAAPRGSRTHSTKLYAKRVDARL